MFVVLIIVVGRSYRGLKDVCKVKLLLLVFKNDWYFLEESLNNDLW